MKALRKTMVALVLTISVVGIGSGILSAQRPSMYDKLTGLDRAKQASVESGVQIEINHKTKPSDSHKPESAFKRVSELPQYIPVSALSNGATRLMETRVAYGQIVEEKGVANPQIHQDRQIWVVKTYFPQGVQTRKGMILNAIVSEHWDAETGEFLFFDVQQKSQ